MDEEPIELIRLEGEGSAVVLRITGRATGEAAGEEEHEGPDGAGGLTGEFVVDTPFVRGRLGVRLSPADLRQWQQALDTLDVGQDIAWREGSHGPWLSVEHGEGDDRCRVTLGDGPAAATTVSVTAAPLTDAWFDEAYHRLDLVWKAWPLDEAAPLG